MIDVKLLITSSYTLSLFSQMVPLRGQDMINGRGNKKYYVPFYHFPLIFFLFYTQVGIFNFGAGPLPQDGRDVWNSDFVKMPYSQSSHMKTGFTMVSLKLFTLCLSRDKL